CVGGWTQSFAGTRERPERTSTWCAGQRRDVKRRLLQRAENGPAVSREAGERLQARAWTLLREVRRDGIDAVRLPSPRERTERRGELLAGGLSKDGEHPTPPAPEEPPGH